MKRELVKYLDSEREREREITIHRCLIRFRLGKTHIKKFFFIGRTAKNCSAKKTFFSMI